MVSLGSQSLQRGWSRPDSGSPWAVIDALLDTTTFIYIGAIMPCEPRSRLLPANVLSLTSTS